MRENYFSHFLCFFFFFLKNLSIKSENKFHSHTFILFSLFPNLNVIFLTSISLSYQYDSDNI